MTPHRPFSTTSRFWRALAPQLVLAAGLLTTTNPALAVGERPAILLHVGGVIAKNPCAQVPADCHDFVTAAAVDPTGATGYFVYAVGRTGHPDASGTLAGVQFGIEYGAPAGSAGLLVNSWESCGSLSFPSTTPAWPASGSGNLITWNPDARCQSTGIGVAGYFYVTPYGPAWMRLTPRSSDQRAKVAPCVGDEEYLVAPAALGWVSFGGAAWEGDADGLNPCRDAVADALPQVQIAAPIDGAVYEDDNVQVIWDAFATGANPPPLAVSFRLDDGPWHSAGAAEHRTLIDVPVGVRRLEIRAVDPQGNAAIASVSFTVLNHRNDPPVMRWVSVPTDEELISGQPLRFEWSASDEHGPLTGVDYSVFVVTSERDRVNWPDSRAEPYRISRDSHVSVTDLPANTYALHVHVVDDEGTEAWVSMPFATDNHFFIGPQNIRTEIRLTRAPAPDSVLTSPTVSMEWVTGGVRVQWRVDGGAWNEPTYDSGHDFTLEGHGNHRIELRTFWDTGLNFDLPERNGFWTWPPLSVPVQVAAPSSIGGEALSLLATPNPSTGPIQLSFRLPEPADVRLILVDIRGRIVRDWTLPACPAGNCRLEWDGCSSAGASMPSGIYFARIDDGRRRESRPVHIVR